MYSAEYIFRKYILYISKQKKKKKKKILCTILLLIFKIVERLKGKKQRLPCLPSFFSRHKNKVKLLWQLTAERYLFLMTGYVNLNAFIHQPTIYF